MLLEQGLIKNLSINLRQRMNKRLLHLLCFFMLGSSTIHARKFNDTTLIQKTGWLLYWHDQIIWLEAPITKKAKEEDFFNAREYKNGLNVRSSPNARFFKSIAKGYAIRYYHNDSIIIETNPEFLDSIWILPVKVKIKTGYEPALETMTLAFIKNNNEIFIEYKGLADYDIRDIELLKRCDKRKLKRVKNYSVYPPH